MADRKSADELERLLQEAIQRAKDVERERQDERRHPDALFRYHAERLTASAITQTYHYMIESGLKYSNLTIGEATVFLKIDWNEPETLLYYLAEPKYEVSMHPDSFYIYMAVG
ncbi:unnamed protein product [Fusarium fujikuroi]|nr:uncharacterized protein FFC1_03804 [Fusarium fujikuroi]SCV59335.1 uncharacterized protein FFFS_13904 [Fusarium fujikuroi]VTT60190.1 unnamed protein product [Fusarium fujikuroi]